MYVKLRVTLFCALICTTLVGEARANWWWHLFNPNRVDFELTVIHNNDGESQLLEDADNPGFGGVARFKTVVDTLRKEGKRPAGNVLEQLLGIVPSRDVIVLSSGDNYLAGPEFNASLESGVPYFDSIALDAIRYDAFAVGNHEFDFGPDVFASFMKGFRRPTKFISANLDFSDEPALQELVDSGKLVSDAVFWKQGRPIGVIGVTTPELRSISSPRDVEILDNLAQIINRTALRMQLSGVTRIILISHLQSINEELALLSELNYIDIVIAGGGDELLADEGDLLYPGDSLDDAFGSYPYIATDRSGKSIPVITTTGNYRYAGKLVVSFNLLGEIVAIDDSQSHLVRVAQQDGYSPDRRLARRVEQPVSEAIEDLANNVIADLQVPLNGVRSDVRTVETNQGNLIADSMLSVATQLAPAYSVAVPDVALQNGGGIRNDSLLPPGDYTELDTFDALPFANFVCVIPGVPRPQFKEILENAVSRVEDVNGRFAQVAGFSFEWDPTGEAQVVNDAGEVLVAGTRVRNVILDDGTVIVDGTGAVVSGDTLNIATIDFLARGGDQYPYRGADFTSLGITYQQALFEFIIEDLSGVVSAADYPTGGVGRITRVE